MRRAGLVAVVALLAGCGGGTTIHTNAAENVPASAQAFVAVRTDAPGWRLFVRAVLGRVPRVAANAKELDVALVGGKLVVGGASRVAHPLAETQAYRDALAAAPRGGLTGFAYVDGGLATKQLHAIPGRIVFTTNPVRTRTIPHPSNGAAQTATLQYLWAAGWLTRGGLGWRARSAGAPVVRTSSARGAEQLSALYAPRLFDEIPADALAVVDLPLAPESFEELPSLPPAVRGLFDGHRYDLAPWLDAVLQGETAVYLRPHGEITVVTSPPDGFAAARNLAQLLAIRSGVLAGRRIYHASIGGEFVVSTSAQGIADFRNGGAKLGSRLHGLPAEVAGVVYVARNSGFAGVPGLTGWAATIGQDPTFTVRFDGGSG